MAANRGETVRSILAEAWTSRRRLDELCAEVGVAPEEFAGWRREWLAERAARVSLASVPGPPDGEIARDARGVASCSARTLESLFFAFGWAMAEDRLWQMDYLRRRGWGRLAEVLGPYGLNPDNDYGDLEARTVGLHLVARGQTEALPAETQEVLAAFSDGINALIEARRGRLPVEFEVLEYEPEPWTPDDCLAVMRGFWWQLTGRLYVLAIPKLARGRLGDGELYEAFLRPEEVGATIMPRGSYPTRRPGDMGQPAGHVVSASADGAGSNNWVLAGSRTASGRPLVASDPHLPLSIPSPCYEIRLRGAKFDVAGWAYPGLPAVLIGRNRDVAWGVTNQISSLRDLYRERAEPANPNRYWRDGQWVRFQTRREEFAVRGAEPVVKEVRSSHHGPLVGEVLPGPTRTEEPVALRWTGAERTDELTTALAYNRAASADEFRQALRGWGCPTWNYVFADRDGRIGYQMVGRIPLRGRAERGYRQGWEPADEWRGHVPFEDLPCWRDPERGWIATANNRPVGDDFPVPLSGTWASDDRAARLERLLADTSGLSAEDCARLQSDVHSIRAEHMLPHLLSAVQGAVQGPRSKVQSQHGVEVWDVGRWTWDVGPALAALEAWDFSVEGGSVAATIWEVFWWQWCRAIVEARLGEQSEVVELASPHMGGLARDLLAGEPIPWFRGESAAEAARRAFSATLSWLSERLGPDLASWRWERLHTVELRHPLSHAPGLRDVFNLGPFPHRGDGYTVANAGYHADGDFGTTSSAACRFVADLADGSYRYVDSVGQSGEPGSPHYGDQVADWLAGRVHKVDSG